MKTRIVYPQLWKDEKYALTKPETKVLFMYLITCDSLSLSRYHRISDRQIMFDTGLDFNQLTTGKKELTDLKWCFFYQEWVYHNHDCAYVDYEGRDRVIASKNKEMEAVPQEVREYFNPLITRYKPVLNHKSKTINQKQETNEAPKKSFSEMKSQIGKSMGGISTAWQEEAFRHAEYLGIDLKANPSLKPRMLLFYKNSYGGAVYGRIQQALSFLKDYQPYQRLTTAESRLRYFFDVVQNYEKYNGGGGERNV